MRSLGSTTSPVRLYSGSNRQDKKRDQGLCIEHLEACYESGLVNMAYFEEHKNKILNHVYLSSFAVFEKLAKDNQWECCRYLLPLESVKGELADAFEKFEMFEKRPPEELLCDAWKTFADKLKRNTDWPSEWSDREWNTTNQPKSTLYEVSEGFWSDHRFMDLFFKPMLVFYQMQHFMSSSEQLLAFSLDYDGCGSVIPGSNKDMPDHIFLEGCRGDVTGEKLYLAARDRLMGHMQAMAADVSSKPEVREFHFYDDIYATVVYDFFKDKLELIPEGLQLFAHEYDYYETTQHQLDERGMPTCDALKHCSEPLIGTGTLMPFAQRDQQKKSWQDSVSPVNTQPTRLTIFSTLAATTTNEIIKDECKQRLDELVVSVVNA